jgi:hypothetical protein
MAARCKSLSAVMAQSIRLLSDLELLEIIQRGSAERIDEPSYPMIAGPQIAAWLGDRFGDRALRDSK